MPLNVKDLIVVLVFSTIVFIFIKPTALLFTNERDFARRRIVFYILTCTAFLGSSFWTYAAVAVPTLLIAGRKDSNPSALYLFLLHIIPPVVAATPIFGMTSFIDFNNPLLLAFLVVIPAIRRRQQSNTPQNVAGLQFLDWVFLVFGIMSSVLYLHLLQPNGVPYPSTSTDFLRRAFVFLVGGFAPYFLISRTSYSRQTMLDNASALLIPCVIMSVIAIFETTKGWLLYEVIPDDWGLPPLSTSYLLRGTSLRAMASAGHSLSLGFLLDIAFAVWLGLSHYVPSRITKVAVTGLLVLGLFAAYSRGPWACAVLIYFAFAFQKRNAFSGITKALIGATIAAVALAFSPLGQKVAAVIPFFGGNVDVENIQYRQRLWEKVWTLFQQNPILGDQFALTKMQDLKQGQGIVDLVNGYAVELVAGGIVGLGLFLIFVLTILLKTMRAARTMNLTDQKFGMVGASFACCILGTLFLWALGGPSEHVLWALAALGIGYSYLGATVHAKAGADAGAPAIIEPRVAGKF
jgi:O-antigen ligase